MHTRWESYRTEIEGQAALVRCNCAAEAELAALDVPNLLRVQYELPHADDDGLPTKEEREMLDGLGRELSDWIGAAGGVFVGEVSVAGLHSWLFYVPCGWSEAANLVHRIGLRQNVTLGVEMTADARHRVYHEQLLPSREERRRSRNAAALAELAARGDDASVARPFIHEVTFDNRVQALSFAKWARGEGFVIEVMQPPAEENARYELRFYRHMRPEPARIDADTAMVMEQATRLGGDYVGWETPLCLPKSA